MIHRGKKALDLCARPQSLSPVVLIFGEDSGVVSDAADCLVASWNKAEGAPLETVRLQEDELKKDFVQLVDELSAPALLGGKQILRLRLTGETLAKQFQQLLDDLENNTIFAENFLILEAQGLSKNSKIRGAFQNSKDQTGLQVFEDTPEDLKAIIQDRLDQEQIEIESEALEAFIQELPGDRRLANTEVEKLSLFAMDLDRPISLSDIALVCATEQPKGADDAADAALAGKERAAMVAIDRFLEAGGSPISALRTIHFRTLRALDALSGAKFLRPPVFDRDKPAFNAMLKDWSPVRLNRVLSLLYSAEKTCKQAGAPTEGALKIVLDRISRRSV